MFNVHNKDTRTMPLAFTLAFTPFTPSSGVFIVNFEHVIAGWVIIP